MLAGSGLVLVGRLASQALDLLEELGYFVGHCLISIRSLHDPGRCVF
jgi:hypothetical protein